MFRIMQITAVSSSIQPKHRPNFTSFSTSELCGTDEGSKNTSFRSKGRSREFLDTFFGKKVSAIARHEGRQSCAEKASAVSLPFNKTQNTL
jgi:hypothetical protein